MVWLTASPCLEARVEPTRGFDIFSQDEEIQLGKENADAVSKQMPVLPDRIRWSSTCRGWERSWATGARLPVAL